MLHVFLGFAGGWNPVDLIGRSNPKSGCGIDAAEAVCLTRELEDIFKAHSGYGTGIRIDSRLLIPRDALRGLNGGGSREGEVDVLPGVFPDQCLPYTALATPKVCQSKSDHQKSIEGVLDPVTRAKLCFCVIFGADQPKSRIRS